MIIVKNIGNLKLYKENILVNFSNNEIHCVSFTIFIVSYVNNSYLNKFTRSSKQRTDSYIFTRNSLSDYVFTQGRFIVQICKI